MIYKARVSFLFEGFIKLEADSDQEARTKLNEKLEMVIDTRQVKIDLPGEEYEFAANAAKKIHTIVKTSKKTK